MYHVVQEGETLSEIAVSYGVEAEYLGHINGFSNLDRLAEDQRIYVPGAQRRLKPVRTQKARRVRVAVTPSRKAGQATASKGQDRDGRRTKQTSRDYARRGSKKQNILRAKNKMLWPVEGKVVKRFDLSGKTPSRGIDIAAIDSAEVQAAAPGKIIYAGDGVNGMRNVVIIQHDKALFTVYGHNKNILTKEGDFVSAGQKIALAGRMPGDEVPRLHFQVRTGKSPVDPFRYLAKVGKN